MTIAEAVSKPNVDTIPIDESNPAAQSYYSGHLVALGHWLEEARASLASAPGGSDDDDADPARFQLQGMGMQALATAITGSGGIGIAALIRRD